VTIEFLSRGSETPRSLDGVNLPDVTQEIIDRLPRRVTDAQGNLVDNTNFVMAGPEKSVFAAFEAAGWVEGSSDCHRRLPLRRAPTGGAALAGRRREPAVD
jgi:hypothetical protein